MCQCLICDCWWCNAFGICCAGIHEAWCCICSCWICKPSEMLPLDPTCCHCCVWTGYGGNFCCWGGVCCAPEKVKEYSRIMSGIGGAGGNVIVVQNQGPLITNTQRTY